MAYTPKKVSALTEATTLADNDTVYIVKDGASLKATVGAVRRLASYTVATLPTGTAGALAWVSDASGGPVPVYSDGTNWRRFDDNQTVT